LRNGSTAKHASPTDGDFDARGMGALSVTKGVGAPWVPVTDKSRVAASKVAATLGNYPEAAYFRRLNFLPIWAAFFELQNFFPNSAQRSNLSKILVLHICKGTIRIGVQ
jgi:hypothetical protein